MRKLGLLALAATLAACGPPDVVVDDTTITSNRTTAPQRFASVATVPSTVEIGLRTKSLLDSLITSAAIEAVPETLTVTITVTKHDTTIVHDTVFVTTKPPVVIPPAGGGGDSVGLTALPKVRLALPPVPKADRILMVFAGGSLQAALDSATCGDEIVVPAGVTYTGSYRLPAKTCTGWRVLRSNRLSDLPEGVRVLPADTGSMPHIVSPNTSPAIYTAAGANNWMLLGLHVETTATGVAGNYGLVLLGDGSSAQNTLASMPVDLVIDRSYLHAAQGSTTKRCIGLNAGRTYVTNSSLLNCVYPGQDAQAIGGWNGSGPYFINNNRLEGSGENIIFGGADPAITNLVPESIEISDNDIIKPAAWRTLGYSIKTIVELKAAKKVVVERNIIRGSWINAQVGFAIVLGSVNQSKKCTECIVEDVVIRWNLIDSATSGINIFQGYPGSKTTRSIAVVDNLFTNIGAGGGSAKVLQLSGPVHDVTFSRNTGFAGNTWFGFGDAQAVKKDRLVVKDNLGGKATYAVFSSVGQGTSAIRQYGDTAAFTGNLLFGAVSGGLPAGNSIVPLTQLSTCMFGNRGIGVCAGKGVNVDSLAMKLRRPIS